MAFFRIKKIKGNEYGYAVENEWKQSKSLNGKKAGSRQKVREYLGKILRFELNNNIGFIEYCKIENLHDYIENNESRKIIKDLVEWELNRFGVNKDEFLIDLNYIKIQKSKRNVALMINNGLMCSLTLKNLLEFKADDEQTDGYRLARAFVEAGITIPQEVFIGLFGKLHKNMEKQKSDFTW